MQNIDKKKVLRDAKIWFKESFAESHIKNTLKLINPNEFNINHFTTTYLANFLTGNSSPESKPMRSVRRFSKPKFKRASCSR